MIKRTRGSNPNMNQLLNEDSFTNKKGIDVTQAPPMRDFVLDANNLDVNLDGSMSLRKPLIDTGVSTLEFLQTKILYDGNTYLQVNHNSLSIIPQNNILIKYVLNGVTYTSSNYTGLNFTDAVITNTATSSLINGVLIDLTTFQNGTFNPGNLTTTTVYGDFKLYLENNIWYLEYIRPYVANILRTESSAEFNPNIAGYYTYALRDTYDAYVNSVNGILAYSVGTITDSLKVKDLTETDKYGNYIYSNIDTKNLEDPIYLKAFCNFLKSDKVTYYGVWEYTTDGINYNNIPEFVTQWRDNDASKILAIVDNTQSQETLDPTDVTYIYRLGVDLSDVTSEEDLIINRPDILKINNFNKYTQFRFSIYYVKNNVNLSYLSRDITKLSGATSDIEDDSTNNYKIVYKYSSMSSLYYTEDFELSYDIPYNVEIPDTSNVTAVLKYSDSEGNVHSATVSVTKSTDVSIPGILKLNITGQITSTLSLANDDVFNINKFTLFILINEEEFDAIRYLSIIPNTSLPATSLSAIGFNLEVLEGDYNIYATPTQNGIIARPGLVASDNYAIANFNPETALSTEFPKIYKVTGTYQDHRVNAAYLHEQNLTVSSITAYAGFTEHGFYQAVADFGETYFSDPEDDTVLDIKVYPNNCAFSFYHTNQGGYVSYVFGETFKVYSTLTGGGFYNARLGTSSTGYKYSNALYDGSSYKLNLEDEVNTYMVTKLSNFILFRKQNDLSLADNLLYYSQHRDSTDLISYHTLLGDGIRYSFTLDSINKAYNVSFFLYNIPYGEPTEMLNKDFINPSKSKKLYYKYRLYSYGEKDFKNNIYVSDSNSFITGLLNTIDLPTSQDSQINAMCPWREYLIAANDNNIFLITPQTEGFTSKVINTFIGIPTKDSETLKSILNGVIFKSGSKIYSLQPSVYSNDDSILNVIDISKPIAPYIVDTTYDNFAFTTEQYYCLCIPSASSTLMLKYEYATKIWTKHTYNDRFIEAIVNTVDDIRIIGANRVYIYGKSLEEFKLTEPAYSISDYCNIQHGDLVIENNAYVPHSFEFYVDTGQKSYSMNNIKQFVESKLIFAILNSKDSIPLNVDIYVDNYNQILHIDPSSSSSFWRKMETLVLGADIPADTSVYSPCIKQLFLRYSGKGYTIRHKISGLSYSNFKFYVSYYRYKSTINKH